MACIQSDLKTIWQERLDRYTLLYESALDYYDFLLGTDGVESFKHDTGETMSWAKYTNPSEFQLKVIDVIESQIDHYRNKINGTGIVKLNLSRGR